MNVSNTPIRLIGIAAALAFCPAVGFTQTPSASTNYDLVYSETLAARIPQSPRDSLSVKIGTADIKVNYGRPSKRGRVVFNGLSDMKWGMVWRTGANEATHFTTSKPLSFGASQVPAGTYTLFTLLREDLKWELIISKQTKQWGTEYDAKQDLVRIPMTVTNNNPVVEKMEIQVKPAGAGGEIIIQWDTYKAVAAFTVK